MKFTFLGTGTSQGVPVVACQCKTCISTNAKDKRLRCAAYIVSDNDDHILIDIGTDIRQQMLINSITDIDAILLTHEHNDHTAGLDDIRPINFLHRKDVPVYGLPRVTKDIEKRFHYIFSNQAYPGLPKVTLHKIESDEILIGSQKVQIIPVLHGNLEIIGFRFGPLGYITDASSISSTSIDKLQNLDILILNALQKEKHYSHFNLEEAIEMSKKIGAKKTYLTHISHRLGKHTDVTKNLPKGIELAYDGFSFEF